MKSDLKTIFLIGAHGVAIAGVFFAVISASRNIFPAAIAFGAMAGATTIGLIAWWNLKNVEPTRKRRLGDILYRGGRDCGVILAIAGVIFAWAFSQNNPFWAFVAPFTIVVFWFNALICWIIGRASLYFLAGR